MEQEIEHRDWAELHRDVLMVIFRMVGVINVLKSVGFVCRAWRKITKDEPEIWRRIDMTDHEYDASILIDQTKFAIDRSKGTVEEFWIRDFVDDALLKYLRDRTNVLKSLRLIMCSAISEEVLVDTVKAQPFLEDLHLTGDWMTNMGLKAILEGCPRLETLDISACHNVNIDSDMRARCSRLKTSRLPEEDTQVADMEDSDYDYDYGYDNERDYYDRMYDEMMEYFSQRAYDYMVEYY